LRNLGVLPAANDFPDAGAIAEAFDEPHFVVSIEKLKVVVLCIERA
jgi:hypothetical protein